MSDLEEIRRKKMQELQEQTQQQATNTESQENMRQEMEMQRKQVLIQILTPEARSRLGNIRLTKPEMVEQIELQLIQLAQSGGLQNKITDDQLKVLLKRISGPKKEMKIRRK